MVSGFSIIVCSYNPDLVVFKRLLNSLSSLLVPENIPVEFIIVDNNSTSEISGLPEVKAWVQRMENKQLSFIKEQSPGLTQARVAGICSAKYDWIVFFDDDNEPIFNYLTNALDIINLYPKVGLWGPGVVEVEYVGMKETKFLSSIRHIHQEKFIEGTHYDNNNKEGSLYFPYGTGMVVRKNILIEYIAAVKARKYSMIDRNGTILSSAGDTQILYTGLKLGYYAGSSSLLSLKHLITRKKVTVNYILRLIYALNSSQIKAYNEVFNHNAIPVRKISNIDVILLVYYFFRKNFLTNMFSQNLLDFSAKLGQLNASLVAGNFKKPFFLKVLERILCLY
ncbi:glycosyltransferase [Pontibacter sp. KCTC 32443]|uniref:glycosyltransferase n=1 Tax=Pontibacter TaxID=323449 RepID=UPI00164E666E|nr:MULTISPECIES: glycosyltransferase [Pontibacter]MBC5773502.1 glycosyltransferase [Pontibacter sp. KCTC 32443]